MLSFKVIFFVVCFVLIAKAQIPDYNDGAQDLTGDDLKNAVQRLTDSLSKLKTAHYTIGNVKSAAHTYNSGDIYAFKVDLVDENNATKACKAAIWYRKDASQVLRKFVLVKCEGAKPVYEEESP